METTLNIPPATGPVQVTPSIPRTMTTKVHAVETSDAAATLPSNKPFVAQIVSAQLSGTEPAQSPSEIAPPEYTLRPYDVPMLPYKGDVDQIVNQLPEIDATSDQHRDQNKA